jgi:glycogen operon protein
MVSYREKHNDLNGEGNRDGDNNNFSDNYGIEGPTKRADVEALRARQIRNMLATLLLSQGVPMLLSGDECRRTQQGNNNAYCQDNAISWFDWTLVESNKDLVQFVRELIRLRLDNPTLRRRSFLEGGRSTEGILPDVEWFSPEGTHVDWYAADASLTCFFGAPSHAKLHDAADLSAGGIEGTPRHVLIFCHAGALPRTFHVPQSPLIAELPWRVFVDTGKRSPHDIYPGGTGPLVNVSKPLELPERSLVCFVADVVAPRPQPRLSGPNFRNGLP